MLQIKSLSDIDGLTIYERRLVSAWRETYGRHCKQHRVPDKYPLKMLVELVPIGGDMATIKCSHISRPIQGKPTN